MDDILDLRTKNPPPGRMKPGAAATPLHLLRTYTGWRGVKEYSTKEAIRHIHYPPDPFFVFGTHTSRYPVRAEDDPGLKAQLMIEIEMDENCGPERLGGIDPAAPGSERTIHHNP